MLQSPEQGKNKSTFYSVLFGKDYFSDQLGTDIGNKDEKMKISQYWCLEWAEFEAIYRRKDVSALKNFITNNEDTFRAPYARKDARHPRPCVFVGTSNEKEILHDPTGDRRFWIVPVTVAKIPLDLVRQDRDKIWAAADALHKSGYQWWLLDAEELIRAERNKEYQSVSYWDEVIETLWCELGKPDWLATEAIVKALGFENAKEMKPGDSNELNKSMTRLGFSKCRNPKRINGILKRGWEKLNFQEKNENLAENLPDPVTPVTALPSKDSGCYTPVTVGVTGVTEEKPELIKRQNLEFDTVENTGSNTETPSTPSPVKDIPLPPPMTVHVAGFFGESQATVKPLKIQKNGKIECDFKYDFADGSRRSYKGKITNRATAEEAVKSEIAQWEKDKMISHDTKYKVQVMGEDDFIFYENCTLPELPNPPVDCWYHFVTPDLKTIRVAGMEDFELMPVTPVTPTVTGA